MKLLCLTNSDLLATVDDEDYDRLKERRWFLRINRGNSLSVRCTISDRALANYVMRDMYHMYDHKNRDALINTKDNLRLCTTQQNQFNTTKRANKTSKYKGVSIHRRHKGKTWWVANIYLDRNKKFLGLFENEIEAAKKYDEAAKELFGEFANLNFN